MYGNPYMQNYNTPFTQQSLNERIDTQIAQLNQMKEQMKSQQPTSINQTFQLMFSINAFISSAAQFHTIIFSDFIQNIFDANNEFTFNQLGYSLINVSILAFISSIIFCGGK